MLHPPAAGTHNFGLMHVRGPFDLLTFVLSLSRPSQQIIVDDLNAKSSFCFTQCQWALLILYWKRPFVVIFFLRLSRACLGKKIGLVYKCLVLRAFSHNTSLPSTVFTNIYKTQINCIFETQVTDWVPTLVEAVRKEAISGWRVSYDNNFLSLAKTGWGQTQERKRKQLACIMMIFIIMYIYILIYIT